LEGIALDEIKYDDNTVVLDLIQNRTGLLAMLNEECIRPNGSDYGFVNKVRFPGLIVSLLPIFRLILILIFLLLSRIGIACKRKVSRLDHSTDQTIQCRVWYPPLCWRCPV
jgi:hypothetical protein